MRVRCFLRFRVVCLVLAGMAMLSVNALASDVPQGLLERFGVQDVIDALPDGIDKAALESEIKNMTMGKALQLSPGDIFDIAVGNIKSSAEKYQKLVLSLISLSVLFWIIGQVASGSMAAQITGVLSPMFAVLLMSEPVIRAASHTSDTIDSACKFMLAFIPVYAAVIAASGAAATASAYHIIVLGSAQIISRLVGASLISLCGVYIALCIAEGFAGELLPKWSVALKKGVNWMLVLAATAFSGILSLQSALTSAADSAGVKTAKFLAGSFVPVIGNAIGDAVLAAQGSINIIRATLGSFGIIAAVLSLAPVLLEILLLRLGLGAAAILADTLSEWELASTIRSFGQLLSILTALLATMALLMIVSTAVVITAGGAH